MRVYIRGKLKSVSVQRKRNNGDEFGILQIETEDNGRYRISDLICQSDMAHQIRDLIDQIIEIPLNVYAKQDQLRTFIAGDPILL